MQNIQISVAHQEDWIFRLFQSPILVYKKGIQYVLYFHNYTKMTLPFLQLIVREPFTKIAFLSSEKKNHIGRQAQKRKRKNEFNLKLQ